MTPVALGRYRLNHRLGVGSMGSVFDAVDERTGRTVVAKIFDGVTDGWAAWIAELRLAARLIHPRIVRCLDGGHDPQSGLMTLIFEKVEGGSFRRRLVEGGPIDDDATWTLLQQVGEALAEAHRGGVMHRDIKPENVFWSLADGWRVTDFGAGRFLERGSSASTIVGSTAYMAPEVLTGSASFSCDQFSLGALGVEARTGLRFSDETRTGFVLENRGDQGLPGVLAQLLATQPEHRFPEMDVVVALASRRSMVGYEQRPVGNGLAWRLDEVVSMSEGPLRSRRVPGLERFVHALDASEPVAQVQRRAVVVREALHTLHTVGEGDDLLSAHPGLDEVWCRNPEGLSLAVGGAPVALARAEGLSELHLSQTLSLQPQAGVLFLAQHGAPGVLSAMRVERRLVVSILPTPGPVFGLGYSGERPAAVVGSTSCAWVLELTTGAAHPLSCLSCSVDAIALPTHPVTRDVVTRGAA